MKKPALETVSFVTGAVSAIAASACCALPVILVSLGVGGAWLSRLRSLERFFPVFVGIAVAGFGFGFYRMARRSASRRRGNGVR
jgi:mercuric ion transport protein